MLSFVAVHELVAAGDVADLLEVTRSVAAARLEEAVARGLVSRLRFGPRLEPVYRVTAAGAREVDARLPALSPIDLTDLAHLGLLPWLWLTAQAGRFGETGEVLTGRQLRALAPVRAPLSVTGDRSAASVPASPAVSARPGLGVPDLAWRTPEGGWATADLVPPAARPDQLDRLVARLPSYPPECKLWFVAGDRSSANQVRAAITELGLIARAQILVPASAANSLTT